MNTTTSDLYTASVAPQGGETTLVALYVVTILLFLSYVGYILQFLYVTYNHVKVAVLATPTVLTEAATTLWSVAVSPLSWFVATPDFVETAVDESQFDRQACVDLTTEEVQPEIWNVNGQKRVVCSIQKNGVRYVYRPEVSPWGAVYGAPADGLERDTGADVLSVQRDNVPKCLAYFADLETGAVVGQCCRCQIDSIDGLITAQHVAQVVCDYMAAGREIIVTSAAGASVQLTAVPTMTTFGDCDVAVLSLSNDCLSKLQLQKAKVETSTRAHVKFYYFKQGQWWLSFGLLSSEKGLKPFQRAHTASTRKGSSGAVAVSGSNTISVVHTGYKNNLNLCVDIRPFFVSYDYDLKLETYVRVVPRRERLVSAEEIGQGAQLDRFYGPPGREVFRVVKSDGTTAMTWVKELDKSIKRHEEWLAQKRAEGAVLWFDIDDEDEDESSITLHQRKGRPGKGESVNNAHTTVKVVENKRLPPAPPKPDLSPAQIAQVLQSLGVTANFAHAVAQAPAPPAPVEASSEEKSPVKSGGRKKRNRRKKSGKESGVPARPPVASSPAVDDAKHDSEDQEQERQDRLNMQQNFRRSR